MYVVCHDKASSQARALSNLDQERALGLAHHDPHKDPPPGPVRACFGPLAPAAPFEAPLAAGPCCEDVRGKNKETRNLCTQYLLLLLKLQ